MSETKIDGSGCADCEWRKKSEAKPRSLLGRLWYWHIKWCPGWKAYQESLKAAGTGDQ